MKPLNQSVVFIFGMLILAAISTASCSTTGIQRSKEATTTMTTMESDIKLVLVQLDATGASLDELTKPDNSDVQKAFYLYKDNVLKIGNMEKDFAKHTDEMNARGKDYFKEWEKEGDNYKNPRIQELSDERRMELSGIYGDIATNSIGVKDNFKAYVSDLKEIQTYLSNDLTPKGIESIASISGKVVQDGDNLKSAIQDIQAAIKNASLEMSQ
jgi:hypothetical protein